MLAIRVTQYGGPEVLTVAETPKPEPQPDEILVKVKAAGVNPVDTYIVAGHHASTPPLPFTPGNDCAGVVESVGADVTGFKPGDRVYTVRSTTGSYAEYCTASANRAGALHANLSFAQGAALGVPYYTAYRTLVQLGEAKAGETVLVHGASGAVGLACVQLARSLGLRVLGTAGTEAGRQLVLEAGAHRCFDHTAQGYTSDVMNESEGGVNMIVEMLANKNLAADAEMLAMRGRIMVVGSRGTIEFNPRSLMLKESSVRGVILFKAAEDEWREMHAALAAGQAVGWLKPVIGERFPLKQASEAQREVIAHTKGSQGKIIIEMPDSQ